MAETHRRRMSAPNFLMTSSGATTLPTDLLILRPWPSSTKPWVSTLLYGATPLVPTLSSREEWNQPRCWSLPSRYMSAGERKSGFGSRTAACETPESNQTSRMSFSFSSAADPHFGQTVPVGSSCSGLQSNQTSELSFLKISATWSMMAPSAMYSPQAVQENAVIGTPQERWRDTHQSGRFSIMP